LYHEDGSSYRNFLLTAIIRFTGAAAMLAAIGSVFAWFAWLDDPNGGVVVAPSRLPDTILGTLLILLIAVIAVGYSRAVRIINKVGDFEAYERAVKADLSRHGKSPETIFASGAGSESGMP
jgi:hypothetical protein